MLLNAAASLSGIVGILVMYYAVILEHRKVTRLVYFALSFALMGFAAAVLLPYNIAG